MNGSLRIEEITGHVAGCYCITFPACQEHAWCTESFPASLTFLQVILIVPLVSRLLRTMNEWQHQPDWPVCTVQASVKARIIRVTVWK